ncbi:MAG: Hpt domain-containing protein, partial [Eubacterium sp.]|nr:Hpt domain-containing protein [Eubacterium sp.]
NAITYVEVSEFEKGVKKSSDTGSKSENKTENKSENKNERDSEKNSGTSSENKVGIEPEKETGSLDGDEKQNNNDSKDQNTELPKLDSADVMEGLKNIGIDTETGLKYSGDDEEFYQMLVQQYSDESMEKTQNLSKFFAEKDWSNYEIVIHAIKSTSRMIGAEYLSDDALKLEKAANASDEAYITENHERVMSVYKNLCSGIKKAMGQAPIEYDGVGQSEPDDVMEFGPESDDVMEFEAEPEEAKEETEEAIEFEAEPEEAKEKAEDKVEEDNFILEFGSESDSDTDDTDDSGNSKFDDEIMEFDPID